MESLHIKWEYVGQPREAVNFFRIRPRSAVDVLAYLEPRSGKPKMKHPGTYNANPLSAAAGVAALKRVASGEPCRQATAAGRRLRNKLNELCESRDWPLVAYGDFSMVRIVANYRGERPRSDAGDNDCLVPLGGDLNTLDGP